MMGQKYKIWNFFIDDRDTKHFCATPCPSFHIVGHVITRDHWSRDPLIGEPWFGISSFWNFSDISISDRDTPHFCAAPWPSFQKVGHVTIRSATLHLLLVAFGILQMTLLVIKLLLIVWYANVAWEFATKMEIRLNRTITKSWLKRDLMGCGATFSVLMRRNCQIAPSCIKSDHGILSGTPQNF